MKELDVMLDLETLSLQPTAAITQIAVVPFGKEENLVSEDGFCTNVDATTCAMFGLDFDQETVNWWARQQPEAQRYFLTKSSMSLPDALTQLNAVIGDWKKATGADKVVVWSEGTDFDPVIIRHAYKAVYGTDECMPWKYNSIRDVRTYVHEIESLLGIEIDIPRKGVKHNALDDCRWQVKCVQEATSILLNKIQDK